MKKKILHSLTTGALLGCASCFHPCGLSFKGKVTDPSEHPLDSVQVAIYQDGSFYERTYTDSSGTFFITGKKHSVFMFSKCRLSTLEFSKKGYKTVSRSAHVGDPNWVIYLEEE